MNSDRSFGEIDDITTDLSKLSNEELEQVAAASVALDIGTLVYQARIQRDLTQSQAARRTGFKQQSISRYESGEVNVTFQTLERLLRKLEMALEIGIIDEITGRTIEKMVLNDNHTRRVCRDAQISAGTLKPAWRPSKELPPSNDVSGEPSARYAINQDVPNSDSALEVLMTNRNRWVVESERGAISKTAMAA